MNTDKDIRRLSGAIFLVAVVIPYILENTVDKTGVQHYFSSSCLAVVFHR